MNLPIANVPAAATLVIPRHHGAWAALAASFVLGAWAFGDPPLDCVLLAAAATAAFVGRYGAGRAARLPASHPSRAMVWVGTAFCAALALFSAVALVGPLSNRALVPIGLVAAVLVVLSFVLEAKRKDRTIAGEAVNLIGLALVAPAAASLQGGVEPQRVTAIGILAVSFFVPAVLRVRCRVRGWRSPATAAGGRPALWGHSLLAHAAGIGLTATAAAGGALPAPAIVALVPATAHAFVTGLGRPARAVSVRRVGLEELVHTVAFLGMALAALRR